MNNKSKFSTNSFIKITLDKFIFMYKKTNPNEDILSLKSRILYFKELKESCVLCECGNQIWIIGSAITGKGCFTCISGETDQTKDYEIA